MFCLRVLRQNSKSLKRTSNHTKSATKKYLFIEFKKSKSKKMKNVNGVTRYSNQQPQEKVFSLKSKNNGVPRCSNQHPNKTQGLFIQKTCLNSSLVMNPSRSRSNNLKAMLATVSFVSFSDTLLSRGYIKHPPE